MNFSRPQFVVRLKYVLIGFLFQALLASLYAETAEEGPNPKTDSSSSAAGSVQPSGVRVLTTLESALGATDPVIRTLTESVNNAALDSSEQRMEEERMLSSNAFERGKLFLEEGNYTAAQNAFTEYLETNLFTPETQEAALSFLGRSFRGSGNPTRAAGIFESLLRLFPDSGNRVDYLLQLAELYREMGLPADSIATFYRVLNAIVVARDTDLERFQETARRVQFEIAKGHFDNGEWEQSLVLLERIDLFQLHPEDRELVHYFRILCLLRLERWREALAQMDAFIRQRPESSFIPEMLSHRADALTRSNRGDEALETLLELLERGGQPDDGQASLEWLNWKKRAGNDFANRFFHQGDFRSALRLYQSLAGLDADPLWRIPVVYHIGLCFEQLGLVERAVESFEFVVLEADAFLQNEPDPRHLNLRQILTDARWRIDHLNWKKALENDVESALRISSSNSVR